MPLKGCSKVSSFKAYQSVSVAMSMTTIITLIQIESVFNQPSLAFTDDAYTKLQYWMIPDTNGKTVY